MKNITVIGVGYVGLVTGTCFADLGNRVIALDISEKRIENLKQGILPIYEPGLKEVVDRNVKADRLRFTTDYAEALREAEFVFICVGTPEGVDGEADLQYVRMAAESIAKTMDHELIVINKSTVPVGTGDWVANIIREHQPRSIPFAVVSCPEFLREGSAVRDFFSPDRTVLGSTDKEAASRVAQLHLPLRAPIVITDLRTAEMIKYASNAFLATRISFINEIANICEALGADVKEVAQGMGYDKRIGHHFLEPGVGYGGSCFLGSETIYVLRDNRLVPQPLEALFTAAGDTFIGDVVEMVVPKSEIILAFDLVTNTPALAEVYAYTRRTFNGQLITLTMQTGQQITATADHPMLRQTPQGLEVAPMGEIGLGDVLIALENIPQMELYTEMAIGGMPAPAQAHSSVQIYRTLTVGHIDQRAVSTHVYSLETSTHTVIVSDNIVTHNCFPKDVKALAYMAQVHGTNPELLHAVMGINQIQRKQIIIKLQDLLGDLNGKTVALLGLAFKENTDDIRVSPALEIAEMLHDLGAAVRGYDPAAMEHVARAYPFVQLAEDPYDLASGCDAIVVATPWNEFKGLDMARVGAAMRQKVMVDGRNLYDSDRMKALGFTYRGVGRGYNGALERDTRDA